MPDLTLLKEYVTAAIEIAGVVTILVGAVVATAVFAAGLRAGGFEDAYRGYRRNLGRAILLGLELLVAADIIDTVAVRPALEDVAVLGGIVLIRTFLSFALETEISGELPWRRAREAP